jgi:hypothetical protein
MTGLPAGLRLLDQVQQRIDEIREEQLGHRTRRSSDSWLRFWRGHGAREGIFVA